jgi:hypothetical protein
MRSAEVINQGDQFVTVSKTAESGTEAARVLENQGIRRVFKGDQNQLWDAVLANQCLVRAFSDCLPEGISLFVQDEKLGTPDGRLRHYWRRDGRRFALTEDYHGRRSGAVWEHQDVTYGLFYTEPIDPESFAAAGFDLPRTSDLWARYGKEAAADSQFMDAMEALGVSLRWERADGATRLGPTVDPATYAEFFRVRPDAALYYALTKSTGLYGIVPTVNDDITTSSIPAASKELVDLARWLLVRVAARGAMRAVADRARRSEVKARARRLARWTGEYLDGHPEASIADVQVALGEFLWRETAQAAVRGRPMPPLDRTSRFMALDPEELHRLEARERSLYFFLDLALAHPAAFTAAYNEALNRVGFGLQRVKYEPATGRYSPPFFVEYAPGGEGTPVYRYSLELSGGEAMRVTLTNRQVGTIVLEAPHPVRSAAQLFRLLFDQLPAGGPVAVVGKAAPFAAELKRWPRTMALPRQGSKYAPMIDHLLAGLKGRGVLENTCGLVLRVGLNGLDALAEMGDRPHVLPRILEAALGRKTTCRELAARWGDTAARARARLQLLGRCRFGQHAQLARVMTLNARGSDLEAAAKNNPRLTRFLRGVGADAAEEPAWAEMGDDLPGEVVRVLETLLARRDALLARRRKEREHCSAEVIRAWRVVDCQILVLCAAYVRRLLQQAESLPYLNDRPYSLALWLLFGPDVFRCITSRAEFDFEFMCERVPQESACACC